MGPASARGAARRRLPLGRLALGDWAAAGTMAEAFAVLWSRRSSTMEAWRSLQDAAELTRDEERESCVRIQKLWRGQRVRAWVTVMRLACVEIERVFRGHLGRLRHGALATARTDREELAVFHYHAILCQRTFRGYYSRRYRHDFNARKAYISSVVRRGEELRETLEAARREQVLAEAEAAEKEREAAFKRVVEHLHHLVSTKSVPGVYNSPYDVDHPPSALGVPVETHLTNGVKDLLLLRDYARPRLARDLNGTRRVDVGREPNPRSLQASSPYDAPLLAARMEAKLERVGFIGAADLRTGQRVHDEPYQRGINEGSEFYDPWKNPYLQRGIPRCKEDLQHSVSTLGKAPKVPFYTRTGGNMSSIHANGIFDVILTAGKTGGVTGRQKAIKAGMITRQGDIIDAALRKEIDSDGRTSAEDESLFEASLLNDKTVETPTHLAPAAPVDA